MGGGLGKRGRLCDFKGFDRLFVGIGSHVSLGKIGITCLFRIGKVCWVFVKGDQDWVIGGTACGHRMSGGCL